MLYKFCFTSLFFVMRCLSFGYEVCSTSHYGLPAHLFDEDEPKERLFDRKGNNMPYLLFIVSVRKVTKKYTTLKALC